MHKNELKKHLGTALRMLMDGTMAPAQAHEAAHVGGKLIQFALTEVTIAKANGEKPIIPDWQNQPIPEAASALAKAGANKRAAVANHRS